MPDYTTAWLSIADHFKTGWGNTSTLVLDDEAQDAPDEKTFARLNIQHTNGNQATMGAPGSNRFRRFGLVTVQIFQKQGDFGISARELAENALALFAGVENDGINYYNGTIREIGNDGRGWYQINVITEFRYDEIT